MTVLLIGERANEMEKVEPQTLELRLQRSAFKQGEGRIFLKTLGLEWDYAINLLPGLLTKEATWDRSDRATATRIGKEAAVWFYWESKNQPVGDVPIIVLLGARVCEAFGVNFKPFTVVADPVDGVCLAILPHPSRRNRLWNDMRIQEQAKEFVAEIMEMAQ